MKREAASGNIFGLLTGKEPLTALDLAGIVPAVNASFRHLPKITSGIAQKK